MEHTEHRETVFKSKILVGFFHILSIPFHTALLPYYLNYFFLLSNFLS